MEVTVKRFKKCFMVHMLVGQICYMESIYGIYMEYMDFA